MKRYHFHHDPNGPKGQDDAETPVEGGSSETTAPASENAIVADETAAVAE